MGNRKRRAGKKAPEGEKPPRMHIEVIDSEGIEAQAPNPHVSGFTMRDEARNTVSHLSAWGQNEMLRRRPVAFVSAGFFEPLKDSQSNFTANSAVEHVDKIQVNQGVTPISDGTHTPKGLRIHADDILQATTLDEESLVYSSDRILPLNRQGNTTTQANSFFFHLPDDKKLKCSVSRSLSPQSASDNVDSSDEIILFKGRASRPRLHNSNSGPKLAVGKQFNSSVGNSMESLFTACRVPRSRDENQSQYSGQRRSPKHGTRVVGDSESNEEDAILADYIANLAANSDNDVPQRQRQIFNEHRELGGLAGTFGFRSADIPLQLPDPTFVGEDGSMHSEAKGASEDEESSHSELEEEDVCVTEGQEHSGPKRLRSLRGFANAIMVTTALDDLDIQGWDPHPPTQRKGRRRKQAPTFDVSDSEIEMALRSAWERDRERKKARRMEREALHASGLIGKEVAPEDLRVRYRSGMTLEEVKQELLAFLLSSHETTQFPPMDKQARKILHELANRFKIKSQSTGRSDQRRPVLYRTKRTIKYAEDRAEEASRHVEEAAIRVRRKYFHRLDVKGKTQPKTTSSGARFSVNAVTYRDGEIAGASIPELGEENKGRAMLEKMGWAKGMGLGAVENKGILEPVMQIIKRSKAGLG